jgi:hypothetical protein
MNGTVIVKDNVVVTVWEAGKPAKTYHVHNTWGTAGLNALRNWFAGLGGTPITHIAWVDTAGVERARDIVTQRYINPAAPESIMFRQYLPSASSANGYTLTTIRAYNAQTGGTRFAEATFDAVGVAKTANNQITVEWTHSFADGGT